MGITGNLFDLTTGLSLKLSGMKAAAESQEGALAQARMVAIDIAINKPCRTTDSDEVCGKLEELGLQSNLGPAAGSIFKTSDWEFTGQRRRSHRITNHAREIKIWRLL